MPQVANRVDILAAAWSNDAFRRVVLTGAHEQVVVMTIPPGGDIGEEVHASTDQVLAFVDGHGEASSTVSPPPSARTTWCSSGREPATTS